MLGRRRRSRWSTRAARRAGARRVFVYNPPVVNAELGIRAELPEERGAARRGSGARAACPRIVFGQSRNTVEVMLKYLRDTARATRSIDPTRIMAYRGGYLPETRREIERELRDGRDPLRGGHQRARARHRHRRARRGGVRRLPGLGRRRSGSASAAPGGAAGRASGVLVDLERAARSVPRARARVPARRAGRAGAHRSGQRRDPGPAPEVRRLRAAVRARRGASATCRAERHRRRARVPRAAPGAASVARADGRHASTGPPTPIRPTTSRCAASAGTTSSSSTRRTDKTLAEMDWRAAHTMLHEQAIYQHDGEQYQVERLDFENHKAFVAQGRARLLHRRDDQHARWRCIEESGAAAARAARTRRRGARSASSRRSSATRRSSSTPTRTSATATCACPRCRCTRPRSGSPCPRASAADPGIGRAAAIDGAARHRRRARDGGHARAHVRSARSRPDARATRGPATERPRAGERFDPTCSSSTHARRRGPRRAHLRAGGKICSPRTGANMIERIARASRMSRVRRPGRRRGAAASRCGGCSRESSAIPALFLGRWAASPLQLRILARREAGSSGMRRVALFRRARACGLLQRGPPLSARRQTATTPEMAPRITVDPHSSDAPIPSSPRSILSGARGRPVARSFQRGDRRASCGATVHDQACACGSARTR